MNRRSFLKRLAGLGAGIVVVGPSVLAEVQRHLKPQGWDDHEAHVALHQALITQLDAALKEIYGPPLAESFGQPSQLMALFDAAPGKDAHYIERAIYWDVGRP